MEKLVKVTMSDKSLYRQMWNKDHTVTILNSKGESCIYKFVINDPSLIECDFWILSDGAGAGKWEFPNDNVAMCPKENVYGLLPEVSQVHVYDRTFVRQFYNIITLQWGRYDVPKTYFTTMPTWWLGLNIKANSNHQIPLPEYTDYKYFTNCGIPAKTKLLSVVSSNKSFTQGHRDRLAFVEVLKKHFGDQLDVFGRGIKTFDDKWDVTAPYKYHITLENSSVPGYWTEKLVDAFMAGTYPIYYGAPDIHRYFNRNSLMTIDIHDPIHAIQKIEDAINADLWGKIWNILKNLDIDV